MMCQPVWVLPASVIQVRQPRPVTTEPQTKGIADITGACNSTIARIAPPGLSKVPQPELQLTIETRHANFGKQVSVKTSKGWFALLPA